MSSGLNAARIGWVLCRVVVPLWVAAGVVFKLVELSPKTLPKETILNVAHQWGIDLYILLATLIALEILAVVVMLMLSRLARPMAIFVLSVFCLILIGELVQGNLTSCGCFGEISIPPWAMLLIDGPLLIGVLLFNSTPVLPVTPARWPVPTAVLLIIAGSAASFWRILPERQQTPLPDKVVGDPDPVQLPAYWFSGELDAWVGRPWREIDLFGFITEEPQKLDSGKRYVVFYGRTCDHCDEMFHADLIYPALGSLTTAVEVPFDKTSLRGPDPWPMPQTECEHLQLPVGCDWIMTTPLTVTVEDGIVTCAQEGGHEKCMGLKSD